jgi:hypothetical protein
MPRKSNEELREYQRLRRERAAAEPVPEGQLCENGCGQLAGFHLLRNVKTETGTRQRWYWCCSSHYRKCPAAKTAARKKQKATTLERLGVENHQSLPEIQEKRRATNLKRYGYEHPNQVPEFFEKRRATNLERFGNVEAVASESVIAKKKAVVAERYGARNVFQLHAVKEKSKRTLIKRLGVPYYVQHGPSFRKIKKGLFGFKDYALPSGRIIKLQGYEPDAVATLLQTHQESDLDFDAIPSFTYEDGFGRECVYHPDLHLLAENLIIEVKSHWTLAENYEINKRKQLAVLASGRRFQFWVRAHDHAPFEIIEEVLP